MTLEAYVAHWLPLAETHLKPRTLASYRDTLRLHLLPAFGAMRVRDLQRGKIKVLLAGKLHDHNPNSVRIMHATLRVILNAAVDDELILANPADKLGRTLKLVAKTKSARRPSRHSTASTGRVPRHRPPGRPVVRADVGGAGALRAPTRRSLCPP